MSAVLNEANTRVPAARAEQVVREFFAAYGRHDVEAMVEMCADVAAFNYVPFEIWGKQRVLRGDGKVCGVGKVIWTGLIDAFPDLSNRIQSLVADDDGNVAAQVDIGGTQAKVWGTIDAAGKRFDLPHLFRFRIDEAGRIASIQGYWDGADLYRQLGRNEID